MPEKQYEFTLPVGTVIKGGTKPGGKKGEHFQYHVEEVLGQGGFGITYKVWAIVKIGNATTKAYFAVKEHFVKGRCHRAVDGVTVEYADEAKDEVEDSLKDFVSEGRLLNSICNVKNPNDPKNDGWRHVVPVNEVVEANNTAYFVMEYLDGGSLRKKVPAGGLDEQVALAFMKPICRAVAYIHRNNILHLDIKPDNIVMRRDLVNGIEEPVLIDFGVSYHFDSQGRLTTTHTSLGHSEGYSPTEQYGVVDSFQPQVDVYALGATFFYLLTGKEPPSAFNVKVDTIASQLPPTVSERTRAAIVHAMAKDADYRTPTVQRFMEELAESITLPIGFMVNNNDTRYFVAETRGIHPGYIEYSCVKDEKAIEGRQGTKTLQYRLLELFVKGVHQRQKNASVTADGKTVPTDDFYREVQRSMNMTDVGERHMNGEQVEREIFRDNGTTYAVCDYRFRPETSVDKIRKNMGKMVKPLAILAAVAACAIALFFLLKPGTDKSQKAPESTAEAEPVEAVEAVAEVAPVTDQPYTVLMGKKNEEYSYTGPVDEEQQPNGIGKAVFKNGRVYEGPFVHGKLEGTDATFYLDGDVFEGEFRDNMFYQGRYTVKDDGSYFEGTFTNGQPDKGSWYDKNGNKLE